MSRSTTRERTEDDDSRSSQRENIVTAGEECDESSDTGERNRQESKFYGQKQNVELRADATALYGDEDSGGRGVGTGTTIERVDRGLASTIGEEDRDGYGRSLSGRQRHRANRLRKWQRRSHQTSFRDRSLRIGLDEIRRMATALGLGKDIRTTACQLFRQATNEGLLMGRSIEGIASACLYIGTRTFGYPRSFDEIAHVSRVDRNHIVGCYTTVRDKFELELGPIDPKTYLPRVAATADANPSIERTAREIIEHAQSADGDSKSIIGGTRPTSIVASALYAAAVYDDAELTQATIADAANVHVSTIRNNYGELLEEYQMRTDDCDEKKSR